MTLGSLAILIKMMVSNETGSMQKFLRSTYIVIFILTGAVWMFEFFVVAVQILYFKIMFGILRALWTSWIPKNVISWLWEVEFWFKVSIFIFIPITIAVMIAYFYTTDDYFSTDFAINTSIWVIDFCYIAMFIVFSIATIISMKT